MNPEIRRRDFVENVHIIQGLSVADADSTPAYDGNMQVRNTAFFCLSS